MIFNKKYSIKILCTMGMGVLTVHDITASAELCSNDSSIIKRDYKQTLLKFSAIESQNKSLLTTFKGDNISFIDIGGNLAKGSLINYYESENKSEFGVSASSLYRMNERIVISGGISYNVETGKNMSGSAFINPEYMPFDIIETTEDNAGTKRHEMYMLDGAIGYLLSERISLGGKLEYRTENYAKFKDLRHQNTLMNLDLSVGMSFNVSESLVMGAAYTYNRNLETVYFKIYGNTDRQYSSLISFGGFYGRYELFGESGYTSETRPLFTQTHGGAYQILLSNDKLKWFNEISYNKSSGRFGRGSSTSVTYSNHSGYELGYKSKIVFDRNGKLHIINVDASYSLLENNENSFKESTDQSGVSEIIYYGSNKVGEKIFFNSSIKYNLLLGNNDNRADWDFSTSLGFSSRALTSSLYPFYRKQDIDVVNYVIGLSKNWFKKKNVYSVSFNSGYSTGWGDMNTDGTYTAVSEDQKQPFERHDLLVKEYDYMTSSQLMTGISLGYEREISRKLSAYTVIDAVYRKAFNSSMKGFDHKMLGLSFGVKF